MTTEDSQQKPIDQQTNNDGIYFDTFPVVGVGASAGGLQALQHLFSHMPPDSGMAFVIILHLSADHESSAAALLQPFTQMPVLQVTEPTPIQTNHIYVIPPTEDLLMVDGTITLEKRNRQGERRAPIDLFFRTLASTHGPAAAAIVLSGSGADGASGIERIKEHGGVTLVQEPSEAKYGDMPRNALATGMIDYILPVALLPEALISYWHNAQTVRLPAVQDPIPKDSMTSATLSQDDNDTLREIFVLLRTRTNHDFSQYKRPTLLRRIGRRMQVHGVVDLPAYLQILRTELDEVQALLRDLLISVTNFFRDSEVWLTLETMLPQLFAGKESGDQVRVWVAGCATGEEAYSVAILLTEYAATLDQPPHIQIFATDIDEEAINAARQGLYRETITSDISPERLARFFVAEQGRYRIKREIRDIVLFAVHNLLRDPPFSRLDLVTCRNLLIYLNRSVQEQVLKLFHFTIRQNGYLLLGISESTDGVPNLFTTIDISQRLFQRRTLPTSLPSNLSTLPLTNLPNRRVVPGNRNDTNTGPLLTEIHQRLLSQFAPPSVLINQDYDIIHISRGGGRYLELAEGELTTNLLKLIHPSLRIELRAALFQTMQQDEIAETRRIRIDVGGETRLVGLIVQRLSEPEWMRGYALVVFTDSPNIDGGEPCVVGDAEPLVRQLEEELQRTKEQLRATIEQYEMAVEEHKAANEELQAINEELRATTEELETSKEELQATNEELITLNQEMKHKVEELAHSNNDLQNLMVSNQIGTIFVDRELRIRRYTSSTQSLFNLIPSDINRPLAHITHKLDYDQLMSDATQVIESLVKVEKEVRSADGRRYLAGMVPYQTLEDKIDGVTLTFVDITDRK